MGSVEERAAELADSLSDVRTLALYEYLRMRLAHEVLVPAPAAGSDWTITVPPASTWEILSVQQQLVTSAAVANRNPMLRWQDQNAQLELGRIAPNAVQAASLTNTYTWLPGLGYTSGVGRQQMGLPVPGLILQSGWVLGTTTSALDVADQYSLIVLVVRDWTVGQIYWLADLVGRELDHEILTMLPATG